LSTRARGESNRRAMKAEFILLTLASLTFAQCVVTWIEIEVEKKEIEKEMKMTEKKK